MEFTILVTIVKYCGDDEMLDKNCYYEIHTYTQFIV